MKKSAEKIGQLLNYEKLSNIELLKLPQIGKKDIPDYIQCPKYEKAKGRIDKAMERFVGKVDKLTTEIRQMKVQIAVMKERLSEVKSEMKDCMYSHSPNEVIQVDWVIAKYNSLVPINNDLIDQIRKHSDKHDDTIDKLTEAEEETKEKLEELTSDALSAIDEDIPMVINRLESIADSFSHSENAEDLLAAIDVCLIGLRVYAMFDDLIDDNSARKECKEGVEKINKIFSKLCANDSVQNFIVDIYRHNSDLVRQNAAIAKQIDGVLSAVDQKQLDTFSQSVNAVLTEKIDTNFNYSHVIEQAELDKIVGEINAAIVSLKLNLNKAEKFQTVESPAVELEKAGVNAEKQAKSLRATMQRNVDALVGGPLTQVHFAVQIIDEAVIDDFYQKELRVAASALRKRIVDTIGEQNFEGVLKGGDDRFLLTKAQNAIDNAKLTRLQVVLDKVPPHVKDISKKITIAETDIRKANDTLKKNIRKREQSNQWASQGLCRYCGGKIGGFFTKKCKSCGKPK